VKEHSFFNPDIIKIPPCPSGIISAASPPRENDFFTHRNQRTGHCADNPGTVKNSSFIFVFRKDKA